MTSMLSTLQNMLRTRASSSTSRVDVNKSGSRSTVSEERREEKWLTRERTVAIIKGDKITFKSTTDESMTYSALWWDSPRQDPVTSGQHLWSIKFGSLHRTSWPWVGISNEERLGEGWATTGLFYGGNLSDGGEGLVTNWGPGIKAGDTVKMLVSIEEDDEEEESRLKIWFWKNEEPLGLAFDVSSSWFLPRGFYPTVQFCEKGGTAHGFIKESVSDLGRDSVTLVRPLKNYVDIEGPWKTVPGFIRLGDDDAFSSYDYKATMKVTKGTGKGPPRYNIHLFVINHINFTVTWAKSKRTWKCLQDGGTTLLGSSSEWLQFERLMRDLCQNPDSVAIVMETPATECLKIVSGNSEVFFRRYDDRPGPYLGIANFPFGSNGQARGWNNRR